MKDFRNAVAVVTGAASGIGRALAQELAASGAQVALADVNGAGLEKTLALLGSATARAYPVDVANPEAVSQFALQVQKDFSRISLLINNAGVALYGTFAELSLADMDWLFRINFWGVVHCCKSFLPLLQREPDAHIVNISSVFGLFAPPGHTAYASSKFAVRGFSEALRHELKSTSIRVSCVHPAGIQTAVADNARIGQGANPQEAAIHRESFNKLASIAPANAARTIVKGILRNQPRILIGIDAYRIDVMRRLAPCKGVDALVSMMEKRGYRESPISMEAEKGR
jgi:NAD(P)-dependent dehydrogenase (short-subunit alcohol dehydrogenase family)